MVMLYYYDMNGNIMKEKTIGSDDIRTHDLGISSTCALNNLCGIGGLVA